MQGVQKTIRKRRYEGKTDYKARFFLLKSGKPRVVFRKTNRYLLGTKFASIHELGILQWAAIRMPTIKTEQQFYTPISYSFEYLAAIISKANFPYLNWITILNRAKIG